MAVRSQEIRNPARPSAPLARPYVLIPSLHMHTVAYLITGLLALLAIYAVMGNVVGWGRERYEDVVYGTPRTFQTDVVTGREDSAQNPSHFMAVNLGGQVTIYQLPGGDPAKTRIISGPYLFGAGESKTPVLLKFEDINGDQVKDMIVTIKNEAIVYLNRDGQYVQLSPEERAKLSIGQ